MGVDSKEVLTDETTILDLLKFIYNCKLSSLVRLSPKILVISNYVLSGSVSSGSFGWVCAVGCQNSIGAKPNKK